VRRPSPPRPRAAALTRSPLFCQQILQDLDVQRLVGHHALQAPVLIFQGTEPLRLVDFQTAILAAPLVEGLARDPVAANLLAGLRARRALLQDRDDLSSVNRLLRIDPPS
jgi:hypothetical protein